METKQIDKLFLELSQFTNATTRKEIDLMFLVKQALNTGVRIGLAGLDDFDVNYKKFIDCHNEPKYRGLSETRPFLQLQAENAKLKKELKEKFDRPNKDFAIKLSNLREKQCYLEGGGVFIKDHFLDLQGGGHWVLLTCACDKNDFTQISLESLIHLGLVENDE